MEVKVVNSKTENGLEEKITQTITAITAAEKTVKDIKPFGFSTGTGHNFAALIMYETPAAE